MAATLRQHLERAAAVAARGRLIDPVAASPPAKARHSRNQAMEKDRARRRYPRYSGRGGAQRATPGTNIHGECGMILYVLRHAQAEDKSEQGGDEARRLTPRGRDKMRSAAAGLRALRLRFDAIVTSPFARAAETAEI